MTFCVFDSFFHPNCSYSRVVPFELVGFPGRTFKKISWESVWVLCGPMVSLFSCQLLLVFSMLWHHSPMLYLLVEFLVPSFLCSQRTMITECPARLEKGLLPNCTGREDLGPYHLAYIFDQWSCFYSHLQSPSSQ